MHLFPDHSSKLAESILKPSPRRSNRRLDSAATRPKVHPPSSTSAYVPDRSAEYSRLQPDSPLSRSENPLLPARLRICRSFPAPLRQPLLHERVDALFRVVGLHQLFHVNLLGFGQSFIEVEGVPRVESFLGDDERYRTQVGECPRE